MHKHLTRSLIGAAALAAVAALPAPASAVLPGTNGRILFTSGRAAPDFNDTQAKLYLRTVTSGTGAGAAGPTITPFDGVQHRHATWSPDRTRIAYAAGVVGGDSDIYILNLTVAGAVPVRLTNTPTLSEDNPVWSPDGTRIAYQRRDGTATGSDILVAFPAGGVPTLNLTPGSGDYAVTPAWTANSSRVLFGYGTSTVYDVSSVARDGGLIAQEVDIPGTNSYQPSASPAGDRFCFTAGNSAAGSDVYVQGFGVTTNIATDLSDNPAGADYNCTWSPDATRIAYAQGAFNQGSLVMERSDDSGGFVTLEDDANNFDGNPDWAPDGRPTCDPSTATVTAGGSVSVTLTCADTGPAYEQTPVRESVGCASCTAPANGTLGTITQGDPSTVTYTPNPGFTGTDTFKFTGIDDAGFATTQATATITVTPAPAPHGGGAGGGGAGGGAGGGITGQPPFPAKLEVARAQVLGASRRLDVLAPITARASGRVRVSFQAAGRTERFTAPVDAGNARVRISRRIPAAQARLGTGILTISYPGDADTQPQEVRLRAASRPARLMAGRPTITAGRLQAAGTVATRARGVVRVQLLFEPQGQATRTLQFNARIANGRYRVDQALPADVVAQIAARRGVVHSYTLFTGYRPARMRGEMASFQVLAER